jgi:uncharacterized protein (PEP-CTERM system associated)
MQTGEPIELEMVGGRQTVDPFMNTRGALRWNYEATRSSFMVSGSYRDEEYRTRPELDQRLTSFMAEAQRALTPTVDLSLRASYLDVRFEVPGGDYDEVDGTLALHWRMTRSMGLWFSYQYSQRNSDLPSANYTENRFWLSVGYQRGTPRNTVLNRFERQRREAGEN